MKSKIVAIISGIIFLLFSCTQQEDHHRSNINAPKNVEAKGYSVPLDSINIPAIITVGAPKVIQAGTPQIILTNTNVHVAGDPVVILAGSPKVRTPGSGIFLLPKMIPVVDSHFVAGIPEVVITKDASTKDQNPQNFSSFGKLQGLKHGNVNCMLQDKFGNLWLGTAGGGVSKYDGKYFTHFTENEGLSNNSVLAMLEDRNGNLWFATYGGGVTKYDGKYFTHFDEKDGLSNIVASMVEDNSGNLWFGFNGGGLGKYDGKYFTIYSEKEGLTDKPVLSSTRDRNGNLWFGTEGEGIIKFDGKSFFHFSVMEGLCDNDVKNILEDKKGNLWLSTSGGLCKYDGNTFTTFTTEQGLSSNYLTGSLEDESGNLWFGTYGGGLIKYDGRSFTHYMDTDGLYNNLVFSMLEDKSGNLWFGAYGGGLTKYDGKTFTHFTKKEGLTNNAVFSILEEENENLWFGTNGGGLSKYDGKSFTHFTSKEGLGNNLIWSMLKDKRGNFWFGSSGGGVFKYDGKSFFHFTDKQGLCNNSVRCMMEDKKGNLWFGTEGGGVCKYDGNRVEAIEKGEKLYPGTQDDLKKVKGKFVRSFTNYTVKDGLSNNVIFSMLEDKNGDLWFGTYGGGINKLTINEEKGPQQKASFTRFTEKEGLSNNFVFTMIEDKNGNLWFGTSGGGVSKYDGKNFIHFTEKEGLSNNVVLSILEDKKGNLWFGTRFGLSKLANNYMARLTKMYANSTNDQLLLFKNYTYQDGFLGIGCNANAIHEDKQGTIWIGANDRLTVFHAEGEESDNTPPNIQLTNVELFNENIAWAIFEENKDTTLTLGNGVVIAGFDFDKVDNWYGLPKNLSLAYNNNYLTFNFIGITQKQSKKVKYQYKLEGYDENWSVLTSRTDAPYGNLPNGSYTFKVKAMNSEGNWSNEFNYPVTIRPPWSKTWWFRSLVGLFILISLYSFYRWRTASLREAKKRLEKTVEERTAEVVHQKDEAEKQRNLVEKKQKEILDSITYAKRIQEAILPSDKSVKKWLPDSFILYKPKDIVAGDFYWIEEVKSPPGGGHGDVIFIAAADCTGHGVPGAMVSVVCNNALNRALREFELIEPDKILNKTRELVIEQFEKSNDEVKDGMDISLYALNNKTNQLQWAGANNPLWIIRNGILTEYKPNKQPIGKYPENNPFTNHLIPLQKGDSIYIFTDGYVDQFGGAKGKKFKALKMRKLLLSIQDKQMKEQLVIIDKMFEDWKGSIEQVDDVCIIGVRY